MRPLSAYRRLARECAVQALHIAETGKISIAAGLLQAFEFFESEDFQEEVLGGEEAGSAAAIELFEQYARMLAEGVWQDMRPIDWHISASIPGYDYDRLALVDRNVLRVAVWELQNVPYVPPAVTINEAVEIAKRYSTADSGRFVNGVLGTLVRTSPKAEWDPKAAPQDPDLAAFETIRNAPEPEVEVETVEEGSHEAKTAQRFGVWQVREDPAEDA